MSKKIKPRRNIKKKLWCLFVGHNWVFTGRTKDWLHGGTYSYLCAHCNKTRETSPYKGGEY